MSCIFHFGAAGRSSIRARSAFAVVKESERLLTLFFVSGGLDHTKFELTMGRARKSSMALIESPEHNSHEARPHSPLEENG